jgi:hypothetical protein
MKYSAHVLIVFLFLISCSKDVKNAEVIINTSSTDTSIEIPRNSILNVNLGNFGDEEGAGIFKHPKNARVSLVERSDDSNTIYYQYIPKYNYTGRDTAILTINRGSDGAHTGNLDLLSIYIVVGK